MRRADAASALRPPVTASLLAPQTARARLAIGPFAAEAQLAVSAAGILAAGAGVAVILLSVATIIRAAKAPRPSGESLRHDNGLAIAPDRA